MQVSSCDTCKEGHRKCNGLEPCLSCEAASIQCTYDTLSPTKKKAHDAYVLMKKQENSQLLRRADIIVARLGKLDIAGTNNNFGPILSQVINLPRYEAPPSDFQNDAELITQLGSAEKLLIDCYFNHFNYYIPILNRKMFMEQLSDPKQFTTIEVQKLLACVLATGFAFRQEMGDRDVINRMEPMYGTIMNRKFMRFNSLNVFNSTIVNCQCYLILTGFYSSVSNYDAVHNLVALSHSTAAGLGLNRTKGLYYQAPLKDDREHTVDTIELGHRVFWSVVIVCSGYSLSHQSPFITSNDYDIPFPHRQFSDSHPDYEGVMQDDFEGIRHLSEFVPMYEISSRIADITCTATRQRPHTKVDEVREMLHEWRTKTLSPELRITPTDIAAIERQSRFSKFYHAVSYMFEVSLHNTFQLHDSHHELGVHGIWNSYSYEAAQAIVNIYKTRPMTRMNAHVVLSVAAGAFATVVASKTLGKEESAQQYCNEIKSMLSDIVRASSSVERAKILGFVEHGYRSVTRNAEGPVEDFKIRPPTSPPWNERSPTQTSDSSPTQTTDMTVDTDAYTSDEEDEQASEQGDAAEYNKRMSGHFNYAYGQQQQQQQQQQQGFVHPSMTSRAPSNSSLYSPTADQYPQHQGHPMVETNYATSGYNGVMAGTVQSPTSAGSFSGTLVSPGFPPYSDNQHNHNNNSRNGSGSSDNFAFGSNQSHIQQWTSSDPSLNFATDGHGHGPKGSADSGFSSNHGSTALDQEAYFVERHHSDVRHQQQQQQQQHGSGSSISTANTAGPTTTTGTTVNNNTSSHGNTAMLEGLNDGLLNDLLGQGIWEHLNDAQITAVNEYHAMINTGKVSPQEQQMMGNKLHQKLIALGSTTTTGSTDARAVKSEDYDGQAQYMMHQHQQHPHHQQHQHHNSHHQQHPSHLHHQHQSSYSGIDIAVPTSLNSSQLLSGGFDGTGSLAAMTSIGFTSEDLVQDAGQQRFFHPTMISSIASSSNKSFPEPSDSSQHHLHLQHLQQQQNLHQQQQPQFDNLVQYQQHHHQSSQVLNMSSFPPGLDPADHSMLMYAALQDGTGSGAGPGSMDNVFVDQDFQDAILNGATTAGVVDPSGGASMNMLISSLNDPNLLMKQQLFSSVASKNLTSSTGSSSNSNHNHSMTPAIHGAGTQQHRPLSYQQAR